MPFQNVQLTKVLFSNKQQSARKKLKNNAGNLTMLLLVQRSSQDFGSKVKIYTIIM
jgi:hypothetical protein